MSKTKPSKRQQLLTLLDSNIEYTVDFLKNGNVRVGYCCHCGECCKTLDIKVPMGEEVANWLSMREDMEITRISDTVGVMSLKNKCKHLKEASPKYFTCEVHCNRPSICKGYPPAQSRHETCTFIVLKRIEYDWFTNQVKKREQSNG